MLRVGLTGGIGAGKSTVAAALAELGAVVVDADRISREVVEPGTEGLAEVVAAFGEDVLDEDGALDRPALGRIVFADDDQRARLNAIVHPRIGARTAELVEAAPTDAVVVHDVPLLVENGLGPAYALVIVVDAPVEVRVARLGASRGMSEEDARSRIAAQADDAARREAADVWIDNSGEPGAVRATVAALWADRIAPFAENLRAGRAVPAPADVVTPDPDWAVQGRRLAARAAHACPGARVEHVGPTAVPGLPAPDVVDVLVVDDGSGDAGSPAGQDDGDPADAADRTSALVRAGFPSLGPGEHGGADPARPVRVWLRSTAALAEARDRARAQLSDGADPAAVRAAIELG